MVEGEPVISKFPNAARVSPTSVASGEAPRRGVALSLDSSITDLYKSTNIGPSLRINKRLSDMKACPTFLLFITT